VLTVWLAFERKVGESHGAGVTYSGWQAAANTEPHCNGNEDHSQDEGSLRPLVLWGRGVGKYCQTTPRTQGWFNSYKFHGGK
jgi:hypothetical protein